MKVSEIGEFGLIDLIARTVNQQTTHRHNLIIGIGDDAAAWQGDSSVQLATVDSLVQDVHFSLENASWADLGWKALAISLSDIAAMGGIPEYALVALSLPDHTEVADVISFYQGMIELAQQFKVAIAGGNISRAPLVVITVTVLGSTSSLLTRSASRPGDQAAVTGYLGAAAAGMEMLSRHLQLEAGAANLLKNAFVRPFPRIAEGQLLRDQGVRAAIDISDGLIADLAHVCQASQVGSRIEVDRVPVHPAAKASFGDRSLELALSGGEDYELLFTASSEVINSVRKAASCPITIIGEITDNIGEVAVVDSQGNPVSLTKRGWEHF